MDEAEIQVLYHGVRALSTRLFVSPFSYEELSRALHSGTYEELLAQLLSSFLFVAEHGDKEWPPSPTETFPSVVSVGYMAAKYCRSVASEKRFTCLEGLARVEDRWRVPREVLYCWKDKATEICAGEGGFGSQIDFWELSSGDKLKVLLELLDAAMGTTRIRDYLEMKAVGALFLDEPGEDGSLESCSLCDSGGDLVCCDTCPRVFHTRCLNVSRKQLGSKEEEWTCPECRGNWPDELDDVRLEKIGLGSNGEVFWLGDHCVIEGTGDMEQGELKIHKGNDIKPILERVEVFHGSLHHKAIEFSEETEKKDSGGTANGYLNHYVDNHDPAAQTLLDKYLRKARFNSKKENRVRLNGMPARFRYRSGDGPEGFCKTYLLCLERALGGLLVDGFWAASGIWTEKVKKCGAPAECGRLLLELLKICRPGPNIMKWSQIEDRPFGHQGRRDDEHFADAYMPQRFGSWEYYRGKAARDECCSRLPRKEALKLAKRSGMYEVDGVAYRLFQHIHRPVISSQLQVGAVLEGARSWSVLADAFLQVDTVIGFGAFEPEKSDPWEAAKVLGCAPQDNGNGPDLYEVCDVPECTSGATEKLVAGDMPIWLVKRYEDERRHKKEEEQSTVPGNTNPVQDSQESCGLCGLKEPMWVRNLAQLVVDWICCDKCEQWYHQDCLMETGVSLECTQKGSWLCNLCRKVKGRPKRTKHTKVKGTALTPAPQTPLEVNKQALLAACYASTQQRMLVNQAPPSSSKKKRGRGSINRGTARLGPESIPASAHVKEWKGVLDCGSSIPLLVASAEGGPCASTPNSVPPLRRRRGRGKKRSAKSAPRTCGLPVANTGESRKCIDPWDVKQRIVDGIQRKCRRVSCGWVETWQPDMVKLEDLVKISNENGQNDQKAQNPSVDDPIPKDVKPSDIPDITGNGDTDQCQLTPASHQDSGRRVSTRLRNRHQSAQVPESTPVSYMVSLTGANGSGTPIKIEEQESRPSRSAQQEHSSEPGNPEKRLCWGMHNSSTGSRDQDESNPVRMKLRKRSHSSGEAPETATKSVSNGGSERASKRTFVKEEWRKTAEGVLKRVQLCQQWVKIAKMSHKKMGLTAVQNCLPDCSKPEEVIGRVLEVFSGWAIPDGKQAELMNLIKKQWQSRGLTWPKQSSNNSSQAC